MSTLKLGTIATQDGTESTEVTNVVNGSAKAWVNFNGQGTVAIRKSFNISSITDVAVGKYTANFETAMPDSNYVIVSISADISVAGIGSIGIVSGTGFTTTTAALGTVNSGGSWYDQSNCMYTFFG
tara:strand:- start:980 stop:1357 length:378 start_codon:yes stop_codon:yes gene_type:complete